PGGGDATARPVPLVLSAKSEAALREQAARLSAWLGERAGLPLPDVAHTLATGRARFDHRAVVVADGHPEAVAALAALAGDRPHDAVVTGRAALASGPVLVFPGQGSQWADMAVELLDTHPVFAAAIEDCHRAFAEFTDWSLLDVLRSRPGAPGLDRVDVVQPALFAVMVSLARCWQAYGVTPAAVIGHSQGEIAAAHIAGALSLRDAAKVVTLRSKAITALAGTGGMASLALPAADVERLLAPRPGRIGIAAVNGPRSTVVSGDAAALDALERDCAEQDIRIRRIPVDYASHSAHVEELDETLHRVLDGIAPMDTATGFISTVTGEPVATTGLGTGYWYRNLRRTVRFEQAVRTAYERGHRIFIEVSPHPVLTAGIEDTLQETAGATDEPYLVTGTLRREEGGPRRLLTSVAEVHTAGGAADLVPHPDADCPGPVDLPTYAFQRRNFWLAPDTGARNAAAAGA
ncbi:acyltransferase domain-containing protein, partial [Streptomyces clavuligerus]